MKITTISALSLSLAAACGNDGGNNDAKLDGPAAFPAPPALNAQIDRLGRPAINTALNGVFLTGAAKLAQKDAYNAVTDPAMFATAEVKTGRTIAAELAANLAIFDVLDRGASIAGAGCGNQALYTSPATATSYGTLARVLADDRLYVDTSKPSCNFYLSLEVDVATGGVIPHSQCGGRAPSHDVIDTTYSLMISGLNGFNAGTLEPLSHDGVDAHTDISDTAFPFLGAPH
ncbi:hypothetical protein BH11MYX1_BH11MYX1_21580 [soil metagenome]